MFPGHSDLWEFPIKDGGSIFGSSKNQKPGLDRVVFKKGGGLVGLITHAGSGAGQFVHCSDGH
ncbi:Putative ribonuclease/ribotoxin [Septoria linicola]|uniref:Ribonuclease/ribotoxin n=1 Tax=Septoria linicola TaxID=215465 RepID=A0A9Q9EQD9_9PEZI|nr:putative ribonuclease/ribotoxin [Septoria linicola]USW59025.1 Putative ribonuclease/ribotoxin [Septoria linicola]